MKERDQNQLKELYDRMVEMGNLCQDAIGVSVKTLSGDEITARKLEAHVFTVDRSIDNKEREIEDLCTRLLLQQPGEMELRRITAALKMITDLERIGDQASDIAELAIFLRDYENRAKPHLTQMADEASRMVREAVDAFIRQDLALARAVIAYDDVVDGWFLRVKEDLISMISHDSSRGEECLDILMVAKYLERIGDHATNLAEWVEYAVTGQRSKDGEAYVPEKFD